MRIEATIDLAGAARRHWAAIVVGAGPSGALAARELARQGLDVLLVDKAVFPRPKVCGACLNGLAVAILAEVGLEYLLPALGAAPLSGFCLAVGGREITLSLNGSVALSREALDGGLVRAALAAGAEFLPDALAGDGDLAGDGRLVLLRRKEHTVKALAGVVLAADGLGSRMASESLPEAAAVARRSWIGAGLTVPARDQAFYCPGIIHMAAAGGGYIGLARLEDGRLNLAAALDPRAVKRQGGAGPLAAHILTEAGWPAVTGMTDLPWRGTPALTRRLTRRAATRLFVLGDAAGYVEPFTGEGMAWAMLQAVALAPLAARAARGWTPPLADEWEQLYARLMDQPQRDCRRLTRLLHHPILTRLMVEVVAHCPLLARPLIERFSWPARRMKEAA